MFKTLYAAFLILCAPVAALTLFMLFGGDNTNAGVFVVMFCIPAALLLKLIFRHKKTHAF